MTVPWATLNVDYRDLDACMALVTEKTGLSPSDMDVLLTVSAGIAPDATTVFRPYYVAARVLATRKTQLLSGEGATFLSPLEVIKQLLMMQRALDRSLGLRVPPGHEATLANIRGTSPTFPSGHAETRATW